MMWTRMGVACALVCGGACRAQTAGTDATAIQARAVLVQVPTLVTGAAGEVAFGLSAADFRVRDDGAEQKVSLDEDAGRPLSLVVLMQTGGDARLVFPLYRKLESMLATVLSPSPYRVSIVSFDSHVEGATPFTKDVAEWTEAIDEPEEGDHGAAIFDGLTFAMRQLKDEPVANRRAILLISQPGDDGSKASAKEVLRAAGEANIAIYSVSFSLEKASFKAQLSGLPHLNAPIVVNPSLPPTQAYFNLSEPLRLLLGGLRKNVSGEMASATGGEALRFDTEKELAANLNLLANHFANRYLLSFTPSAATAGFHELDVQLVGHPELSVRARRNYWLADAK